MNVVIVEDDINMRKSLEIALGDYEEFSVKSYKSATEALKKLSNDTDVIVTDINMPGMDGLEFIKELGGKYDVIIMTGNATLNRAIESVRLGVKDFLTKPFDIDTLATAIKRTSVITQKTKAKKSDTTTEIKSSNFLAASANLDKTLNIAKTAAQTDVSVMIMGESGVGKELFSRYIHENSKRKDSALMAINMAAIPENLL
ncbi:MAG: sigma-54-dependent Fis family transcriptional regulator, partial [Campylobacter sp.]|nr:sigma-54-dependent Fis family transcriptional regulator [Campylobacter sp.]